MRMGRESEEIGEEEEGRTTGASCHTHTHTTGRKKGLWRRRGGIGDGKLLEVGCIS